MTLRRTLPRVLASVAAIALVASVPAWSLTHASGEAVSDPPGSSADSWLDPDVDETDSAETGDDSETPQVHPEDVAGSNTGPSGSKGVGGGDFDGTSGWVEFGGGKFWIGPPGSRSEVVAAVAAYRAARGLPAFLPMESLGGWSCSVAAFGTAVSATEPTTETLGQRLIRRSPEAVGFRPAAGWAVSATVVVDELILGDGRVYPNRSAQIGVVHCAPPTGPTPPPADPPPTDPPPVDPPPVDPSPPVEPPTDPEPTTSPIP